MAHAKQISTLRRRRNALIDRLTLTKRQLDEYEESGRVSKNYLISCRKSFVENHYTNCECKSSYFNSIHDLTTDHLAHGQYLISSSWYEHLYPNSPALLYRKQVQVLGNRHLRSLLLFYILEVGSR